MRKILAFLLAMLMLFTIAACDSDNDNWEGEGDTLEFTLTNANSTLNVVLNRDGSCYTYRDYRNTIKGSDINRPELDGEIAIYSTNYGSYKKKDNEMTVTLDSQNYYRFVASGKDGAALKDAYFEVNMSEEHRAGYYGKGVVLNENKGTTVLICESENDSYSIVSLTTYDENDVKISVSIPNADGSYKNTSYYPDGTVAEIRNYDSNDRLVKLEYYEESGVLQYIDECVIEEGRSVTTRTDAQGNVIRTEERRNKNYGNGGSYSEGTIIENGVTIYHSINDEKCDANGVNISSYFLLEEIDGNRRIYNVNYTDHQDANYNYIFSEETVDGVLTYYYCAIEQVTVMEGVEGRQNVTYHSEEDKYTLNIEYIDESGSLVGVGYDYPADEYVHGDWETFEYVIE